jgi:hypothetical protein
LGFITDTKSFHLRSRIIPSRNTPAKWSTLPSLVPLAACVKAIKALTSPDMDASHTAATMQDDKDEEEEENNPSW